MKEWAIERGATHYTHWFQPLTGITAEKHESFIQPVAGGGVLMAFSGKELIRGEPDASSFPSGGLRATFEARGYTAWDPTSFAFIKDCVLCIPTAFCSFAGDALDQKTPLLRSMQAINRQALRILKLLGNTEAVSVQPTVGAEQEYFLIDDAVLQKRRDLLYTGRTLFGAEPPKGQQLNDHYYCAIQPRVQAFMEDLDRALWRLGIPAKTEHNEVAPAQHELAPVFEAANIAADHNHLTMELMEKTARKHKMTCLFHEKPFQGVNGSGKHLNWSLATNTGRNLLEPGDTPQTNAEFLVFLSAVICAVDEYQDLIRASVASASNDCRLGGNEAPPPVVSVSLGEELSAILESIKTGAAYGGKQKEVLRIGVHVLPKIPRDTTDRNRTSPFAFTGNKFEFRMPGASAAISEPITVLNTVVAEQLRQFADQLEGEPNPRAAIHDLVRHAVILHGRIIFNGNGYDPAWQEEAERRGLSDLRTMPDCLPCLTDKKTIDLFAVHGVYNRNEWHARYAVMKERYKKTIEIEGKVMADIVRTEVLPAALRYLNELKGADDTAVATSFGGDPSPLAAWQQRLSHTTMRVLTELERLEAALEQRDAVGNESAEACRDRILTPMRDLRREVDDLEHWVAKDVWKLPTYADLMNSTR